MKFIMILITGMILSTAAPAQTWDEWFKQKKTQKKYLAKQIVLLRLYLGYLKKGYEIADKGLTTIHNIKNGDFNPKNPSRVDRLRVKKGDKVYFRVQSIYNGENDEVSWNPAIDYLTSIEPDIDASNKIAIHWKIQP